MIVPFACLLLYFRQLVQPTHTQVYTHAHNNLTLNTSLGVFGFINTHRVVLSLEYTHDKISLRTIGGAEACADTPGTHIRHSSSSCFNLILLTNLSMRSPQEKCTKMKTHLVQSHTPLVCDCTRCVFISSETLGDCDSITQMVSHRYVYIYNQRKNSLSCCTGTAYICPSQGMYTCNKFLVLYCCTRCRAD